MQICIFMLHKKFNIIVDHFAIYESFVTFMNSSIFIFCLQYFNKLIFGISYLHLNKKNFIFVIVLTSESVHNNKIRCLITKPHKMKKKNSNARMQRIIP